MLLTVHVMASYSDMKQCLVTSLAYIKKIMNIVCYMKHLPGVLLCNDFLPYDSVHLYHWGCLNIRKKLNICSSNRIVAICKY